MKSCDMVIVVPVDGFAGKEEVLRVQVWETVAELLRPELGKLYRQFNPSGSVWEHKYPRPLGVVLGRQEPDVFGSCSKQAKKRSMRLPPITWRQCSARQTSKARRKSAICCSVLPVVDGSDPELLAHGVWHILMQKGIPVPHCGIYYAALHRAFATKEERREVLDHDGKYAACMVTLSQGVRKDD
ncbi:MAG: hypothetical protein V8Q40_08530 [Anaerosacchariphilus sp.]